MSQGKACCLTSTWQERNGQDVNTVLTCITDEEESAVLPENGVVLFPYDTHGNEDKLCLNLSVCDPASDVVITAVDVLCNARHMELYTDKGDYLFTEEGVLVDTLNDKTNLYLLQKTLETNYKQLSIKILSLQCKEELFIRSVQVSTAIKVQFSSPFRLDPAIDLQKVKSMVSDQSLSRGAQNLMDVVENFQQKQGSLSGLQNLGMLMSMFPGMSQLPLAKRDQRSSEAAACDTAGPQPAQCDNNLEKRGVAGGEWEQGMSQCGSVQLEGSHTGLQTRATSDREQHWSEPQLEASVSTSPTNGETQVRERLKESGTLQEISVEMLEQLDMRLKLRIQESEDRLMKVLEEKLCTVEQKLTAKLDKILERLDISVNQLSE